MNLKKFRKYAQQTIDYQPVKESDKRFQTVIKKKYLLPLQTDDVLTLGRDEIERDYADD